MRNGIISCANYVYLLSNKLNAELKLVEYNFCFGFQKEEFKSEHSKLKSKNIK